MHIKAKASESVPKECYKATSSRPRSISDVNADGAEERDGSEAAEDACEGGDCELLDGHFCLGEAGN